MTQVEIIEKYIATLKRLKETNGTLDDAIILAETILLTAISKQ